jgi:hypothetical protein
VPAASRLIANDPDVTPLEEYAEAVAAVGKRDDSPTSQSITRMPTALRCRVRIAEPSRDRAARMLDRHLTCDASRSESGERGQDPRRRTIQCRSHSYYRNKARREAKDLLAKAREMKARLDAGSPDFLDDASMLSSLVLRARLNWKTYLGYCRTDRCNADYKRLRNHEMTHADFMAKWS